MNNKISIIIPTFNEEGNLQPLIDRIDHVLKQKNIVYEIIIVDDHSKDLTKQTAATLKTLYPVLFYEKKGRKGKAQSLIEGFKYAKYDLICMIDGDLQYPPEAIPQLLEKYEKGTDIVIANRLKTNEGMLSRFFGGLYRIYFAFMLHGLLVDVHSGLKLFKKEIIERISLSPTPWTLDLEFLIKARHAGYKITEVDIALGKRNYGKQKGSSIIPAVEIAFRSIYLKLKRLDPIAFTPEMEKKEGAGFHHKGEKYIHHSKLDINETAFHRFSINQILFLIILIVAIIYAFIIQWHTTFIVFIASLTILYFIDLLFNFFLIYRSFSKSPEIQITPEEITANKDWPTYTILCPLYKEWRVLPQFVTAMSRLDYPKDKLQVLLLLEEDDVETVKRATAYKLPSYFQIAIVPHSQPKTKPKALNYGLLHATGDYSVVFDAEDIPDPEQLKKAVMAFKKSGKRTICIQAKLNFYNPHQNVITKVFTAEYSLWFDLVLTGLQSIHAPIPLGGTSNHFRTKDLHYLKGWDAFNVTEDCDLGMRLVAHGFRTAVVNSMTLEEANSDLKNWFRQRTRWIKGYIQTYLVHMRDPRRFMKDLKEPHVITFQLVVGGKILSMFINPLMWVITISYFAFRPIIGTFIESFYPAPVLYMAVISLIFGNFLYMYYYMIGCAKREYDDILKYVFLVPFYWVAMSIAAWKAVYNMITDPHYWAKTHHGLHLNHKKSMKQATHAVGKELVDEKLTSYSMELPIAFIKKI